MTDEPGGAKRRRALLSVSEEELAEILRSAPREISPEEVQRRGKIHDREQGRYIAHCEKAHHNPEESRH